MSRGTAISETRREYLRDWQRRFRSTHPERVKATEAKRDKAARAAQKRALRAKDPEKHKAALRKSFQKHKAKRTAEMREWRKDNKETASKHSRAAKAKARGGDGHFTRQDIERLFVLQNFICNACPVNIAKRYEVDHITPVTRGGTNWPDNIQLLCPACNKAKGRRTMTEWMAMKVAEAAPHPPVMR